MSIGDVKEVNGTRCYETPLGDLDSVTTILKGSKDDYFLNRWIEKVGYELAEKIRDRATNRGDETHEFIEAYVEDSSIKPRSKLQDLIYPFLQKTDIIAQEEMIYSELGYAGRFDALANIDGVLTIIDWKTSTWRKTKSQIKDYYLQLAAYAYALKNMGRKSPTQGKIVLMCECNLTKQQAKKKVNKEVLGCYENPDLSSFEPYLSIFDVSEKEMEVNYLLFLDRLTIYKSGKQEKEVPSTNADRNIIDFNIDKELSF